MDQVKAIEVLSRFEREVLGVAGRVAETFPTVTTVDDAAQDARMLLLSYAGLAPSQYGRGHQGTLIAIEQTYNESRIHKIISAQLRLDLGRYYGREVEKRMSATSLDAMPENHHPTVSFADSVTADITATQYPFLHAHYGQKMTGQEIADAAGIARSTVTRRIASEKRAFVTWYCKHAGLIVEGDETTEELVEAYGHLKAAGR